MDQQPDRLRFDNAGLHPSRAVELGLHQSDALFAGVPGIVAQLTVTYFLSGYCPTGQSQSCVSPGYDPFALSLDSFTCSPFFLQYTVNGLVARCSGAMDIQSFTITE